MKSVTIVNMQSAEKVRAPDAADWALARGISSLTSAELARLLGVPENQVRQRLQAPTRRGEWVMPVRGLWVPVAAEFRTWGAPPGLEIIDEMMKHLNAAYYVGWLTAASIHGAAHQAPQVFQAAVDRQVRDRTIGRTRFEFAQRDVSAADTTTIGTRSGLARISSAATTALDLAADVGRGGGIDNTATVLVELAETEGFDPMTVARLASGFPAAAGRRIGYLLEHFAGWEDLDPLNEAVRKAVASPSRLDPTMAPAGHIDSRWMLYLNREVDPDL